MPLAPDVDDAAPHLDVRCTTGHAGRVAATPFPAGETRSADLPPAGAPGVRFPSADPDVRSWRIVLDVRGVPGSEFAVLVAFRAAGHTLAEQAVRGAVGVDGRAARLLDLEVPAAPRGEVARGDSPRARERLDDAEYVVWYGTTRRPNDPADAQAGYSSDRDDRVHYGRCKVFVPKSHKIGSTGSVWWKRLLAFRDDRMRVLERRAHDAGAHWAEVAGALAAAPPGERDAVVFVHGYNVSFDEAALRAAQVGFDLSVRGAMAFFSWPSKGEPAGYMADEATIEANERPIADYLAAFARRSGAEAVHVIAHSMGNRGVLRAVTRIAGDAERRSGVRFGQIILAAPDVDAGTFRELCAAYGELATRTTLYVSDRDRAVEASLWLHEYARAGLAPPVVVTDGIDTVNVANADVTLLGHGYVASAREVLGDMHALIRTNAGPAQRFGLTPARTEHGEPYWLIGA